ncbi:hypothetical protein LIA77_05700 [Sarocladium implicatum]|nr:hypothetical protein LIA77_05700 [Sarocladium implicatum]
MTVSTSRSPSPRAASASAHDIESTVPLPSSEDAPFPQGQCRYILMVPELKGHRCGCVNFSHNASVPGAMCNCGHLACFHLQASEAASPGRNKDEIEVIKQRLGILEQQSDVGDGAAMDKMITRLSSLEEMVDKAREEFHAEIKGSYRNMNGAWQLIEQLQKQVSTLEDVCRAQTTQLDRTGRELDDVRNRQLELLDSDESLEERIEKLETAEVLLSPPMDDQIRPAASEARPIPPPSTIIASHISTNSPPELTLDQSSSGRVQQPAQPSNSSWTVHVSLLPTNGQRCPFDKDSTAYKRALSRGLQRMVAVDAAKGETFSMAVTRTFRHILQGRPWILMRKALEISLNGIVRLKPVENESSAHKFDQAFLLEHCASLDAQGNMEAAYIAPTAGALLWHQLRQLPVHVEGLESSWAYDASLDHGDVITATSTGPEVRDLHHQRPVMMARSSPPSSSSKRPIADLTQSTCITSMSSTSDAEQGRAKRSRTCMTAMIGVTTGSEGCRAV